MSEPILQVEHLKTYFATGGRFGKHPGGKAGNDVSFSIGHH